MRVWSACPLRSHAATSRRGHRPGDVVALHLVAGHLAHRIEDLLPSRRLPPPPESPARAPARSSSARSRHRGGWHPWPARTTGRSSGWWPASGAARRGCCSRCRNRRWRCPCPVRGSPPGARGWSSECSSRVLSVNSSSSASSATPCSSRDRGAGARSVRAPRSLLETLSDSLSASPCRCQAPSWAMPCSSTQSVSERISPACSASADEARRRNGAHGGVLPARQRLHRHAAAAGQVDPRLVVQVQLGARRSAPRPVR